MYTYMCIHVCMFPFPLLPVPDFSRECSLEFTHEGGNNGWSETNFVCLCVYVSTNCLTIRVYVS